MTENKYASCDKEMLDAIQRKVFEAWSIVDSSEAWMTGTIILADGTHLALDTSQYASAEITAVVDEVFDLMRDVDDPVQKGLLTSYTFSQLEMFSSCGYAQRREELLGWKPGMTVGTPDVPPEVVDEYIGYSFKCPNCDEDEE